MKIAGCDVQLVFLNSEGDWTVVGTLSSGTAENKIGRPLPLVHGPHEISLSKKHWSGSQGFWATTKIEALHE